VVVVGLVLVASSLDVALVDDALVVIEDVVDVIDPGLVLATLSFVVEAPVLASSVPAPGADGSTPA
jgi:hypothetical protein